MRFTAVSRSQRGDTSNRLNQYPGEAVHDVNDVNIEDAREGVGELMRSRLHSIGDRKGVTPFIG